MNAATRRHANVVNLDEVDARQTSCGTKFGARFNSRATPSGRRDVGCHWFEVPAGKSAFAHHHHCHPAIEKTLFVFEGEGTLRIGPDEVTWRVADHVPCVRACLEEDATVGYFDGKTTE